MACRTSLRGQLVCQDVWKEIPFDSYLYMMSGFLSEVRVVLEPCTYWRRHGENLTTHSGGVKNPLKLLWNLVKRHSDLNHILSKLQIWHCLTVDLSRFEQVKEKPEFIFAQDIAVHLENRVRMHESIWRRPSLWIAEFFSGRYFTCANKPIRDLVSDLLAFPQKRP